MKVKIAVFGCAEITGRISRYVENLDDVEVVPFVFSESSETVELVEKAVMCDIYLFAGALPYLYAKEKIDKKRLPAVQIAFDEYMILTSFYRVRNYHNQDLNRLSIDVLDSHHVDEVLSELKKDASEIYTYSFGDDVMDIDRITAFHEKKWKDGKADFALTSIHEVEQKLREKGIPTNCMEIPMLNIERAIEQAKSIATLNQSKNAQIVAGYINIKNFDAVKREKGDLHAQELLLKLHHVLLKYAQKTYSSVLTNSNNQFVLFGTQGILNHITNHYRDFPLLQEMEHALSTPVDIGFGLGLTAKQAEDNAKSALEACAHSGESTCYIVNERNDTIGPLGVEKEFNTSELYQALIHRARLNNELSYNFIDFIEIRNNEPFSANDIAGYYQVTKRSAERTVKKLLAGEVIKVVGEEKPYVKGRPRKLFQINQ
ncbi:hypothetical protein [Virgibacillus siamensis]|uniref:hypothetical protein n=1 Tax=Virgibacillus siamensis TaxID=480071 RepID=UPI000986C55F|nr:hypothetical protein [Virgibacillus siamensis]